MSQDLQKHLQLSNNSQEIRKEEDTAKIRDRDDYSEEEEEEEEFSFICAEANTSPIAAEDAFVNGQIKPIFPLFNRDLLFSDEEPDSLRPENLPARPPVKKVFVETKDRREMTSSASDSDEIAGPYCEWSSRKAVEVSPEACKKSNSTGFSKIWRFKELMGRSHSDGRDAFVFLNKGHEPPAAAEVAAVKGKRVGNGQKVSLSPHEVYLRSKGKDDEKRRTYLPYRPELVGFFTNANSGLSKNVHPF